MLTAIDLEGNKHYIEDVDPKEVFFCPVCQQRVMQRRGKERRAHFAHYGERDLNYVPCTDKWHHDMSQWHHDWQRRFPVENMEVVVSDGKKKHIADILINQTVIEFQHSSISLFEFNERNEFYTAAGYNVIWIFDRITDFENKRVHKNIYRQSEYVWQYVKIPFRDTCTGTINAAIFMQFNEGQEYDPVLELVTTAEMGFSRFKTDDNHILTKEQFVRMALSGELQTFIQKPIVKVSLDEYRPAKSGDGKPGADPETADNEALHIDKNPLEEHILSVVTHKEEKQAHEIPPRCKTIPELWQPNYEYMIVRNHAKMQDMVIHGDGGQLQRDHRDRIQGVYSNVNYRGRYYYSRTYTVWDAEQPVWTLKKAKELAGLNEMKIKNGQSLTEIMRKNHDPWIFVKCLFNHKDYALDLVNRPYDPSDDYYEAFEFDSSTGEIFGAIQNGFVRKRQMLEIWAPIQEPFT